MTEFQLGFIAGALGGLLVAALVAAAALMNGWAGVGGVALGVVIGTLIVGGLERWR